MRNLKVLLLVTLAVLFLVKINPLEAGRVGLMSGDHQYLLLTSLQKGSGGPSAPNPSTNFVPSSINQRGFAGKAMPPPPPPPQRTAQGSVWRSF